MPVPPKKTFKLIRFVIWMMGGTLLGCTVALAIHLSRPKHFESTSVVAGGFQETGETKLSTTHAKLVARNLGGSLISDPQSIHDNTLIRAEAGKVSITARSTNRYDAREIAREAARLFRSIEHEQDLTLDPVQIQRFSDEDRVEAQDGARIRNLLVGQAAEVGIDDFLSVPGLSKEGSAAALALLANEDFGRRFKRYQEIAVPLGLEGVPGQPITPHPALLEEPELARAPAPEPINRTVWKAIGGGFIAGILGGILFGRAPVKPLTPAPAQAPAAARPEQSPLPATPLTKPSGPQDW